MSGCSLPRPSGAAAKADYNRRLMPKSLTITVGAAMLSWIIQPAPPATEIFLAPLTLKGGEMIVGTAINITNAPGYDNQPSFTPDGAAILFTSARDGAAAQGAAQTDIYRYVIATKTTERLTDTPTSEYSPTVTPGGRHFSVVRVEADGTQRLWRFALNGSAAELVLPDVKPVGYHAWLDETTVALFVLGNPPTLQIANTSTGKTEVVASDIGRSLQPVPGGGVSFVVREPRAGGAPQFTIKAVDSSHRIAPMIAAVGSTDPYVAWTPDGRMLMADGGSLYSWRKGQDDWTRVADLSGSTVKGVTRLAVSPKGDWIAMVTAQ